MPRSRFTNVAYLLLLAVLWSSCTSDRQAVSGGFIQKRKYRPGWHVDLGYQHDRSTARNTVRLKHAIPRSQEATRIPAAEERSITGTEPVAVVTSIAVPLQRDAQAVRLEHPTPAVVLQGTDESIQQGQENLMPKKEWNKLAIPVFVLGLGSIAMGVLTTSTAAALAVAVVTVVLGAIVLKRIRTKDQAGKGFALIGFILGIFALLFTAITISVVGW